MAKPSVTSPTKRLLLESSGACGDLGTFIPHVVKVTIGGLAPAGVLFGFAVFLIATDKFYGLPLPVQPMKAISAVILTGGLRPGEVAATGMMTGVVRLVLGATGLIGRLARVIPQSVSAGLHVGLGLLMGVRGLRLMLVTWWIGVPALGMAKAAELHGYPGPKHILDLAQQLRLIDAQRTDVQAIFDRPSAAAKPLGGALIAQERLDQVFAKGGIARDRLAAAPPAIAEVQGRLRAVHPSAHFETRALFNGDQLARCEYLRGYADCSLQRSIITTNTRQRCYRDQ